MAKITRREFLKLANRALLMLGLGAVAGPVVAYFFPSKLEEMPSEPVLVGAEDDLPVGTGKVVRFGRYPALVVHTEAGFKAYSAVCTHFACICKWDAQSGQIVCPCHDGFFDPLDGHVVAGPPPEPLEAIAVQVVNDEIYIGGEA